MTWWMPTGLPALSSIEVDCRQPHQHRLAVAHFVLDLGAAAHDLLGRNPVDALGPRAHELHAAARDDERLEAVRAQVGEHLEHRLVDEFGVGPLELGMLRRGDPVRHDRGELVGRVAGVRGRHDFQQPLLAAGRDGLHVAFEHALEWLLLLPLGMLRGQRLDAVEARRPAGSRSAAPTRACRRCRTWRCVPRGGTKSGPPSFVTRPTKSTIAFFVAPSFHEGSGSAAAAGCGAGVGGGRAPERRPITASERNRDQNQPTGQSVSVLGLSRIRPFGHDASMCQPESPSEGLRPHPVPILLQMR